MRNRILVPALGISSLLLAGCATAPSAAVTSGPGLRAQLPKALRAAGVLKIGSNLNYAPVDFKDPSTDRPSGLDVDLADALGGYLGMKVQIVDEPFAQLIPDVQAGRLDLAMSAVIDTQEREQGLDDNGTRSNPGVDFVDYFVTGTSILVKAGNPLSVLNLDGLCGHTVALQSGTVQAEIATRQVSACQQAGKPLKIDQFATDAQALTEVDSGAAAADLNDYPVAAYNTEPDRGGGRFQVTGAVLQTSPYGITVNKANGTLRDVVSTALDQLIRTGAYDQILAKWNAKDGAVPAATVNGGF
ncbi:ABC transporter substrate-binding protein [Kitasatospora sp. NBC_01287]|uniref:ABC transporter substrate-binding protein n=1 Tax=Kitasatospora sp. NBC_01287 TaxID=2903573 RepID=UPI002254EE34|nr:ABC transporter substrate-binding protein [Kitasatospora sp. NBC_01287]MCX4746792.1 ABC transporter substrate-binding protein [Kitasatospora sp. NBC_01287]